MYLHGAPSFEPPRFDPAAAWPSAIAWIRAARSNALELFPDECFAARIARHSVLGQRIAVVNDPETIGQITGRASRIYKLSNMHLRLLTPALGRGVVVAEGDRWRRQRRMAIRLIADASTDTPSVDNDERVNQLVSRWRSHKGPVDIQPDLTLLALDLLAAELFHYHERIGDDQVLGAIGRHRTTVERADLLDVLGAPPWLGSIRLRRAKRIVRAFDGRIHEALIASGQVQAMGSSLSEARDFIVNLLAGFESIANTATWLIGLIAAHPPLFGWLTDPNVSAAGRSARLSRAVAETLRLYPPLPMVYRQALADHETPVGKIRRGTLVCISPYVIHRNRLHWEAPDWFDPDRVMPDGKTTAYLPFGVGARQCLGKHVGTALTARIVAGVIATLRPVAVGPLPPPRAGLSLRPQTPIVLEFAHG